MQVGRDGIPDLVGWAARQPRLGVAVATVGTPTLHVAGEDPTVRKVTSRDTVFLGDVIRRLAAASTVWAANPASPMWVAAIGDAADLLRSVTVAATAIRADIRIDTSDPNVEACSVRTAVNRLARRDSNDRRAMLLDVRVDQGWRPVTRHGIRIDIGLAESLLTEADRVLDHHRAAWGFPIWQRSRRQAAWCTQVGIIPATHPVKGTPTLSHNYWDEVQVADAGTARIAWQDFVEASTAARHRSKLAELLTAADVDGRVHPTISVTGADTGRMSISKPAVQNIPKTMKRLLVADPGCVLVSCDLNRVEPTLLAALSDDETMIEAVTGGDVYAEAADLCWGDRARRDDAKIVVLALLYGMKNRSLARRLGGVPIVEAARVRHRLLSSWTGAARWIRQIESRARTVPPRTFTGRRLPLCDPRVAVNWVIQGSAADLLKQMTVTASGKLPPEARLVLPVHDELVAECPAEDAGRVCGVLEAAMTAEVGGVGVTATATPLTAEPH